MRNATGQKIYETAATLELDGTARCDLLRLDTPAEIEYVKRGGIMPYLLEELLGRAA